MKHILLVGAGKIGFMITKFLSESGDYHVTVCDHDAEALTRMPEHESVETSQLDVTDNDALLSALDGKYAVISALPYNLTKNIAQAAVDKNVNYFDLTEDVAATRLVKDLAKNAKCALMPQCGLAPGYISIVAYDLAKKFDTLTDVQMRVGALSEYPTNAIKYNLTWSTEGLINEYIEPCEAIIDGDLKEIPPLDGLEKFSMDGINYEAFNTSGGLGTLCDTLEGKVKSLNYKSIRYPGHRDILRVLLQDLRMSERRDMLKDIFEYALPMTYQGVVLIFATVRGEIDGVFVEETHAQKVYSQEIDGELFSAIQITTAAGICGVLDLMANGKLPQQGFVRQEDVDFGDFINNRFGKYYERRRRNR